MLEQREGMSKVWEGITENAKFLNEGAKIDVGNGLTTLFWDGTCTASKPLIYLASQTIPDELIGATFHDMWEHGTGWKGDSFVAYLLQDVLKLIEAHELKNDPNLGDLLY